MKEVLNDFSCSTGVPVAFFTENNSTWRSEYPNMIDYAYDVYVNHFEDEYHWVLIYSQSQDGDIDHPSWYWEGMQGDYTNKVLDVFLEDFNKRVQSQLEAGNSVYKTFTKSFNAATYSFKHQPQPIRPTMLKLHILSAAAGIAFLLWSFKSIEYNREELIDLGRNQKPTTTRCPNCNHTILAYMHDKCPHCQCDLEQKTAITKQQ